MHEADVEIVSLQLAAKAIKIGASSLRIARPGFRHHRHFVARKLTNSFGNMWVTAVCVRSVKEAEPVIVAIQQKLRKALHSHRALVRRVSESYGSGSHRQTASLDSRLAERNRVACSEATRKILAKQIAGEGMRAQPGSSQTISGTEEEVATLHG